MKFSSDTQRMIFGFLLLIVIAALTAIIALGRVEEKTSYGLNFLMGTFSTLAGGFSTYAFTRRGDDKDGSKDGSKDDKPKE